MADLEKVRRNLEEASTLISGINQNLAQSNRFAGTFVETFSGLAGMKTTAGSIWSVIDRFSGQNFYFLQKNVRGFMVIFRLAKNIEDQRVEAAANLNDYMQKQGDFLDGFLKSYKAIDKVNKTSDETLARTLATQDKINKLKIREMGFSGFIKDAQETSLQGIKEQLGIERELVDTQKARENLSARSTKILGSNFQTGFFGDPQIESRIVQLLGIDDEIANLRDTMLKTTTLDERKQIQDEINNRYIMRKVIGEELGDMGINVRTNRSRVTRSIEKAPTDSFFKQLTDNPKGTIGKLFLPSKELLDLVKKAALFAVAKKNINLIFRFARVGLMVFGKVLLAVSMLGLLVFILHQSGFIENIQNFLKNENVQKILGFYFDMVVTFFTGIFNVLKGVFDILMGFFSGDGQKVYNGISKIGEGLVQILIGGIASIGMTIVTAASGIVLLGVNMIVSAVVGLYELLKEGASQASKFIPGAGLLAGITLGAKFGAAGSVGGPLGALIGGVAGLAIGTGAYYLGKGAAEGIDGLATGGMVGKGGMFLVGEKGPELVHLPAGSAVYNNSQTRAMGTTINVSVNGRVGASDAELDDIARKIGQKINLEMNRYNNAGYRV